MAVKFKKGDRVVVIAGEERKRKGGTARTGEILRVYADEERVLVSGVNMVKRHTKQSQRSQQRDQAIGDQWAGHARLFAGRVAAYRP